MNILKDIDLLIIDLLDLPELLNVICVNKFFHDIIVNKPIINQWKDVKNLNYPTQNYFYEVCRRGHLEYAKSLYRRYNNAWHGSFNVMFVNHCSYGRKEIIMWLLYITSINNRINIDIHCLNDYSFQTSCINGHIEAAKYLIYVGESKYGRIDIHINSDNVFIKVCERGFLQMAQWLYDLGENHGYGKYSADVINKCIDASKAHLDVIQWLNAII